MRSLSLLCAMFLTFTLMACSDDSEKPPVADLEVTSDQPITPKPDLQLPDTVATPDQPAATPDTKPSYDGTVPKCPVEVDLAGKEPCKCGLTLIYDVAVQFPKCLAPQVVKCCPLDGKAKCE